MGKKTFILNSTVGTHFADAIAASAAEEEDFPGLAADGDGNIQGIAIRSLDNFIWQFELWDSDDNIIASHQFAANEGTPQIISEVQYYFYTVDNLFMRIPISAKYRQQSTAVRNLSGSASTASGLRVTLTLEK